MVAYGADLAIGDPQWRFHPIRLMGDMIVFFERALRTVFHGSTGEKMAGVVLCVCVVGVTYGSAWLVIAAAYRMHAWCGFFLSVALVYCSLSVRALGDAAQSVLQCLTADDEACARKNLAFMVGRDTALLKREGMVRATVETVAENTSDGIVAPLFYVALGGPALGMAYKAINTLDSMVGYRNQRYHALGWASARCDDLVNYIPARMTALLLIATAFLAGKDWRNAYATVRRDARNHLSPNSGYPESAVAGALQVQLGGPSWYGGIPRDAAFLGEQVKPLTEQTIRDAVVMMYGASGLMLMLAVLYRGVLS
jgi:adenosylcobinamide-phosphate synthase